jgi:hypothetical protein
VTTKFILPAAVIAALALSLVPAASGKAPSAIKVNCTAKLVNHDPAPGTTGDYFGFITCGHGVGTGVQYIKASQTIGATVSAHGTTKSWFDLGTFSANFTASGPFSTSAPIPLTGTAKVTGGTGKYKGAKGSAKVSCTTADLGKTLSCTENITLTRI